MSRSADPAPVLLVEDDATLRKVFAIELQRMGFQVQAMPSAQGVLELVRKTPMDAVLLDLNLPGVPGQQLLEQLVAQDPDLPVVVCTAHGSVGVAVEAMRKGAFDFLTKPVSLDVLEQSVHRATVHAQLLRDNRRLRRAAAGGAAVAVTGTSPAARKLELEIGRFARNPQPVLITGESGAGKELAARELHAQSDRHGQPFVAVNCGAVPRQLIESELFGHVKGAFTGADARRPGLFEAASGGTLFLDEVGELPLELQPALLRAIQFGEIRPVGSDLTRQVDVRVIAATHRDLQARIADGRFREDLYYRLAVLELRVPPLRERREDIGPLARAFLVQQCSRSGRELTLNPAAVQRLEAYGWPGNVRELENAMVRLCVLSSGPEIAVDEIDEHALSGRKAAPGHLPTLVLRDLERLAIQEAMQRLDGNKQKVAEALGISLRTLYNKLGAEPGPDEGRT